MFLSLSSTIAIALLALFGFAAGLRLWRKWRAKREPRVNVGFDIADLHRLHESGQLSREEFERAKASVIARSGTPREQRVRPGFEVLPPRDHL